MPRNPARAKAVKQFVTSVSGKDKRLPHLSEMLEELLTACGGPKRVAALFADGLDKAQAGSLIQQRYLDCLMRLVLHYSKTIDAASQEEGLLSDSDLDRELRALLPEDDDAGASERCA